MMISNIPSAIAYCLGQMQLFIFFFIRTQNRLKPIFPVHFATCIPQISLWHHVSWIFMYHNIDLRQVKNMDLVKASSVQSARSDSSLLLLLLLVWIRIAKCFLLFHLTISTVVVIAVVVVGRWTCCWLFGSCCVDVLLVNLLCWILKLVLLLLLFVCFNEFFRVLNLSRWIWNS